MEYSVGPCNREPVCRKWASYICMHEEKYFSKYEVSLSFFSRLSGLTWSKWDRWAYSTFP